MLATEHVTRLHSRVALIVQAADEALLAVSALAGEPEGHAGAWLPGVAGALERIRLECADLSFALREVRAALPPPGPLQPRLLD